MFETAAAKKISIRGVVQGVGFRPFVYRLAHEYGLRGWVLNHSRGVEIEVEGVEAALSSFVRDLEAQAPPLARIEGIEVADALLSGYTRFEIRHSIAEEDATGETPPLLISPDIATCPDCLRELLDPDDRRFRYPFTNCTNCGPRFTIIADIPYDRPLTTMRDFIMCPQCQREYDDPLDRRFHAQPNACPICGPQVWMERGSELRVPSSGSGQGASVGGTQHAIDQAVGMLREGLVLAIKGLGGFHLACDATNEAAVRTLRQRKGRPAKPLAVMMNTLDEIKRHCRVAKAEERLLTSPQCPIVLLEWKPESDVERLVAPGNSYLGVMLPYTPLHHVLLRDMGRPLVMTSGNLSEEPIARDNDEALRRLGHLTDGFLMHNREIYARYDDSVWFVPTVPDASYRIRHVVSELETQNPVLRTRFPQPIRRSRGYAPFPIKLPLETGPILACGAELKNSFCLAKGEYAFLSQHIGDLENLETLEHFETAIELYKRLFRIEPRVVAHDMHPEYLATKYAKSMVRDQASGNGGQDARLIAVQHHHAHIASCLADNGWTQDDGPVIGVAWDGTGYGTDGHIWGGEFLVADHRGFRRAGHLEYLPLPGGETAIRNPYRLALGYGYALLGQSPVAPPLREIGEEERRIIQQQVDREINCPLTSAVGRLFDAVSALLGVRLRATYEAQAAIELETRAQQAYRLLLSASSPSPIGGYPFDIDDSSDTAIIRLRRLFEALMHDQGDGTSVATIAYRFHVTMAEMMRTMCGRIASRTGLRTVALSGGCFQNRLLLALAVPRLQEAGFRVLLHQQVPCNDGSVSLGQAAVAASQTVVAHFARQARRLT